MIVAKSCTKNNDESHQVKQLCKSKLLIRIKSFRCKNRNYAQKYILVLVSRCEMVLFAAHLNIIFQNNLNYKTQKIEIFQNRPPAQYLCRIHFFNGWNGMAWIDFLQRNAGDVAYRYTRRRDNLFFFSLHAIPFHPLKKWMRLRYWRGRRF